MKVAILASGSNGNATLIKLNNESFLIDNGLSFKSLTNRALESGFDLNEVKSIFVTHEHIDHVGGLKVLMKRLPLKCYLTKGTLEGLNQETKSVVESCDLNIVKGLDEVSIDGSKVTIINTHHDAKEPIGFVIEEGNKKLVYITDTGYVDQKFYPLLFNADMYILESNYDVELLWSSSRTFELKKRIDGDHGHMSNVTSAILLSKLIGDKTKRVVLAHISDDCNYYDMPELIVKEHKKVYTETGVNYSKIDFVCGNRFGVTGVFEL